MSQQTINVGSQDNDGTGDPLRTAGMKCNQNFTELYTRIPTGLSGLIAADETTGNLRDATISDVPFAAQANGMATLDSAGHLIAAQIPPSLLGALTFKGTWNASTNSPTITSGSGTSGWFYIVATAGSTTIDGNSTWNIGDWIVFNGTVWQRVAGASGEVTSVAGRTGNVVLSVSDVSGAAPLASPTFTGTPTAPTQSTSDNSTNIATTAFVQALLAGLVGTPSGTVVFTLLQTAPIGWLMFNDGTIGNASSGAGYANANAQTVFNALYAFSDANAPLLTSGGVGTSRAAQGSAATAWAAGCRITLPRTLGRALAVAGSGAGLTTRNLGDFVGEETHTLSSSEQASMSVSASGGISGSFSGSTQSSNTLFKRTGNASDGWTAGSGAAPIDQGDVSVSGSISGSASVSGTASGGGGAHNNMQPTTFLNAIVKL